MAVIREEQPVACVAVVFRHSSRRFAAPRGIPEGFASYFGRGQEDTYLLSHD